MFAARLEGNIVVGLARLTGDGPLREGWIAVNEQVFNQMRLGLRGTWDGQRYLPPLPEEPREVDLTSIVATAVLQRLVALGYVTLADVVRIRRGEPR